MSNAKKGGEAATGDARRNGQFGGNKAAVGNVPAGEKFTDEMRAEGMAIAFELSKYNLDTVVFMASPGDIDRVLLAGSFEKFYEREGKSGYRSATGMHIFRAAPHLLVCLPQDRDQVNELEHYRDHATRGDATTIFAGTFTYLMDGDCDTRTVSIH